MNWFLRVLKKYAVVSGRAQRAEYWYYCLFYLLIFCGLAIIDAVTGMFSAEAGVGVVSGVFALVMVVPSITVGVRRLHDTSRSGWWLLVGLIPVIGGFVLLVFTVQDSTPGDNAYGPNPKGVTA
jgi:uncharacterized membrane protein YhaH (DUF805 family)